MISVPMPGYVIVKPFIEELKSESIIVMSNKPKIAPTKGEVMAVSGTAQIAGKTVHCPVKVGDKVIYRPFSQAIIEEGKEKFFIINFLDLFATYE